MQSLMDLIDDPGLAAACPTGPLPDSRMETRRQAVLRALLAHPEVRVASVVEEADDGDMRVHVGLRGIGTAELVISARRWDPDAFSILMGDLGWRA